MTVDAALAQTLDLRLARYGDSIRTNLERVYGDRAAETYRRVVDIITRTLVARPADLRALDEARLLRPDWLQDQSQIGYVCYADRFAGTLKGIAQHLDHLDSLGVTYLHLMPILKPREGANDGGYAVADYRSVRPDLGTMDDLAGLASELRARGISLVADLVLNHVAAEHEWATKARAGDPKYRDYFWMFDDRTEPDAYERTLPEVFPDFAPGNFTWDDEADAWVWTTFNSYQWDVNWSNPDVFCEYLDIICNLANHGVEVIRLDAIAFIWKRLGTDCQGEPEVHAITEALRSAMRAAAPAVAFKAEAIVAPSKLMPYLGQGVHHGLVSDMAYHNSLMVQLWSSLASRDTRLFEQALRAFPLKPTNTTWGTYVRCHDDIGWAISDEDAAAVGLSGPGHRSFLSDFYSGLFPGSFSDGLVFQYNPATNDRRISGSCASLAGLGKAFEARDGGRIQDSLRRILLMYTVAFGFGGVPLIYMGDEIAMLNDLSYVDDPAHAEDNRWAHRPVMDWRAVAHAQDDPTSLAGRVLAAFRHVIAVRKSLPQLHASVESRVLSSPDPRLLILERDHPIGRMVAVYNFSEGPVFLECAPLRERLGTTVREALTEASWSLEPTTIVVEPYQSLWFVAE